MDQDKQIKIYLFGGFLAIVVAIIGFGIFSLKNQIQHQVHGDDSHGDNGKTVAAAAAAPSESTSVSEGDSHPGKALIAKSDCRTCHLDDKKLIGPSYADIAARYADADDSTIDTLVGTIKNGGQGNWGNVPMTPHSSLSDSDIRKMVEYILTLDD